MGEIEIDGQHYVDWYGLFYIVIRVTQWDSNPGPIPIITLSCETNVLSHKWEPLDDFSAL